MNKEELNNRLSEIELAMTKVMANYNALEGAKQESLHWLEKINKIEVENKEEA